MERAMERNHLVVDVAVQGLGLVCALLGGGFLVVLAGRAGDGTALAAVAFAAKPDESMLTEKLVEATTAVTMPMRPTISGMPVALAKTTTLPTETPVVTAAEQSVTAPAIPLVIAEQATGVPGVPAMLRTLP